MIIEGETTDTTPTDLPADTGTDAPADTTATPNVDEAASSAFDQGVDHATQSDESAGHPARDGADVAAAAAAKVATPAAAAEVVPAVVPPVAEVTPAAVPDPAVETEIKSLGLKAKAAERFRELTSSLKTKDAEITPLREAKQNLDEWNGFLQQSGVPPQQLGMMIEVGKALNGTDIKAKGVAFDTMLSTLQQLGQEIGRDVPGLVDPLAGHPDLKAAVENGDITEALAKQHAAERAQAAMTGRAVQANTEQQQHAVAVQTANAHLGQLGKNLREGNPALGVPADPFYAVKMDMLKPTLDLIVETLPPSKWPEAVARAYGQLPQPTAPVAAPSAVGNTRQLPPVGHMPIRPGNASSGMRPKPKSDTEAFEIGAFGAASE